MMATSTEKSRYQIALNLNALEHRQLEEAAQHQGLRPGTLVNSLWECVLPLLRKSSFSVYKFKERFPVIDDTSIKSVSDTEPSPQSKIDLWALDFLHYLEENQELEDLLQLADTKRYKRPDVHVTRLANHATEKSKRGSAGRNTKRAASN